MRKGFTGFVPGCSLATSAGLVTGSTIQFRCVLLLFLHQEIELMLLDDSQSDFCGFQAPASGLEIPVPEEGHTVEAQHIHH